jgi:hypothetical protein
MAQGGNTAGTSTGCAVRPPSSSVASRAPDEAAAIEKAIEEFKITDAMMQKRLLAQRVR